ncbi:restriction endonuclease [Glutamicibacter halophytocola]|uniref:Restriction endonuclease n=1 Tax=Glutamicibacter halophytocola TaxID=1933880 RepID=A0ABX5YAB4_9MICC|nr:NaeI family type II restriction endonuclease [Glutamicibacter halophytocola]QDY66597.1 restriction endonuclease [Glutamicibacter halophytocola]
MQELPLGNIHSPNDSPLENVLGWISKQDPSGIRMANVFRQTFDQLYDGQRTGRYRWDQLYKTEKTHFGTLIEINLQREFDFADGLVMDYQIAGHEVDCKYSATASWMLPPESIGHLILGSVADDQQSTWSVGLVRATVENRNVGMNRDKKGTLNALGKQRIRWIHKDAPMPPNILLHISAADAAKIFAPSSGQARVNELFRTAMNQRISRNVVATVAQQRDYMKRVRANGGARTTLRSEGIIILSGDYKKQVSIAKELGCAIPQEGELVSIRVVQADIALANSVELDGARWVASVKDNARAELAPTIQNQ